MNDIDKTLQRDATRIAVTHADTDGRQLAARLQATPQEPLAATVTRPSPALWWLSGALACAAAVILIMRMPAATNLDRDGSNDYTTPIVQTNDVPNVLSLADPGVLEQVSRAVALEEEWVAIQDDVARAKAELEAVLPNGF